MLLSEAALSQDIGFMDVNKALKPVFKFNNLIQSIRRAFFHIVVFKLPNIVKLSIVAHNTFRKTDLGVLMTCIKRYMNQ